MAIKYWEHKQARKKNELVNKAIELSGRELGLLMEWVANDSRVAELREKIEELESQNRYCSNCDNEVEDEDSGQYDNDYQDYDDYGDS